MAGMAASVQVRCSIFIASSWAEPSCRRHSSSLVDGAGVPALQRKAGFGGHCCVKGLGGVKTGVGVG